MAGLNVLRIINEPTAGSLAFGLQEQSAKERKVMIFDFGGGTFDVSILKISKEANDVIATSGDEHLGG